MFQEFKLICKMTALNNDMLQKETVAQLKERLRELDMKVSGSKEELIERLLASKPISSKKVNV